jgi:hypothetical protein
MEKREKQDWINRKNTWDEDTWNNIEGKHNKSNTEQDRW